MISNLNTIFSLLNASISWERCRSWLNKMGTSLQWPQLVQYNMYIIVFLKKHRNFKLSIQILYKFFPYYLLLLESYLDPTMNGFDRSLLHEYEEWATIQPGFTYHGLNTYAYLLDRYGKYLIKSDNEEESGSVIECHIHSTRCYCSIRDRIHDLKLIHVCMYVCTVYSLYSTHILHSQPKCYEVVLYTDDVQLPPTDRYYYMTSVPIINQTNRYIFYLLYHQVLKCMYICMYVCMYVCTYMKRLLKFSS